MGGKSSKGTRPRNSSSFGSSSSSWSNQGYPQSPYSQSNQHYTPQHNYASPQSYVDPPKNYGPQNGRPQRKLERKYSKITDDYNSLEQVTAALSHAGLESSNLIVGIDFTKSNEWTGARSFNRRSLHHISDTQNPYEQAISIIGRTLSKFDEDNLIPCFGFGDASTHDQNVFSFFPDERPCDGFEEALIRYREIVPHLKLAGPTSFAPVIEMAMTIVDQSEGQYHVLLIIADGQVTRSVDTDNRHLSPQEQKTVDAIVKASRYPLSIILVGVGDGPWDMMREFDDNIPARAFDNFQFVNFTEIMSKNMPLEKKETEFALSALMEIPSQYKATLELHILGASNGRSVERVPLPTPIYGAGSFNTRNPPSRASSFQHRASPYDDGYETSMGHQYYDHETTRGTAPPAFNKKQPPSRSSSSPYNGYESTSTPYSDHQTSAGTAPSASSNFDNKVCPICLTDEKDMAFGCGHQTCCGCGEDLDLCPICRSSIQTRIKLY